MPSIGFGLLFVVLSTESAFAADTTLPTGAIVIVGKGGNETATNNLAVTIRTSGITDDVAVKEMCVVSGSTCAGNKWEKFAASKALTLTGAAGIKTVKMRFRDAAKNTFETTDTILFDNVAPKGGTLAVTPGELMATLNWDEHVDTNGSGIKSYKLVRSSTATPPANCNTGTVMLNVSGEDLVTETIHEDQVSGTTYSYRLCGTDNAGNTSTGITATYKARAELNPPTDPSVTIMADGEIVGSKTVTLSLFANDDTEVTRVCLGEAVNTCKWSAYSDSLPFTFAGSGNRTVYALFSDPYGNVSEAASASIYVDNVAPVDGSLAIESTDSAVFMTPSNYTDYSGVALFKVVAGAKASPANCNTGTVLYEDLWVEEYGNFLLDDLINGKEYFIRVCAIDPWGNTSKGTALSVVARPESNPPEGLLLLGDGSLSTKQSTIGWTLYGVDESMIKEYCVYLPGEQCAWKPFGEVESISGSKAFTGNAAKGEKIFNYRLRDEWKNTSSVMTATVTIDKTVPTNGVFEGWDNGDFSVSFERVTDGTDNFSPPERLAYWLSGPYSVDETIPTKCSDEGALYIPADESYEIPDPADLMLPPDCDSNPEMCEGDCDLYPELCEDPCLIDPEYCGEDPCLIDPEYCGEDPCMIDPSLCEDPCVADPEYCGEDPCMIDPMMCEDECMWDPDACGSYGLNVYVPDIGEWRFRFCTEDEAHNVSNGQLLTVEVFEPVWEEEDPEEGDTGEWDSGGWDTGDGDDYELSSSEDGSMAISTTDNENGLVDITIQLIDYESFAMVGVAAQLGSSPAEGCQNGLPAFADEGSNSITFENLPDGNWNFRSCGIDDMGRPTVGATAAITPIASDMSPPVDGSLSIVLNNDMVQLSWSNFTDDENVVWYRVIESINAEAEACDMPGIPTLLEGRFDGLADTHGYLLNGFEIPSIPGVDLYYRVCAFDAYGNMSEGATGSVAIP